MFCHFSCQFGSQEGVSLQDPIQDGSEDGLNSVADLTTIYDQIGIMW